MRPVVLSRPDRVGDVVITSSCIPLVRELYPGAPIIWIAKAMMRPLFSGQDSVDEFIAYDGPRDHARVAERLTELNAETIYHFQPDPELQRIAAEVGIPQRFGFELKQDATGLTQTFPYRKSQGEMHEAEYCRQLLVDAGKAPCGQVQQACLRPEPEARQRLLNKAPWLVENQSYLLINPTTARLDLRWPAEYFEVLIRALLADHRQVILIGHPGDDPALVYLREKFREADSFLQDLSGQLDLAELAWLFTFSQLHISRDTGTSHIAAGMGCHVFAIYARPEPEFGLTRWKPLGQGHHWVLTEARKRWWETRRQFWRRSFHSIQPETVIEAVYAHLAELEQK